MALVRVRFGVCVVAVLVAIPTPARASDVSETAAVRSPITLGARVGTQSIYLEGDSATSDLRGYFTGVDLALKLSDVVGVALVGEASLFDRRSDRLPPGDAATTYALYGELRIESHREGAWSARIDLGVGHRWLRLPTVDGPVDTYRGVEPLRLRVGPAYRIGDADLSLALGAAFGWFTGRPGPQSCAVTGSCADSILGAEASSTVHFVADLSLSMRGFP